MKTKIKNVLFFNYSHEKQIGENDFETVKEYSANIFVEFEGKTFILQVSGCGDEAHSPQIPESHQNLCGLKDQDWACENLNANEIWGLLKKEHNFKNNFDFLQEIESTL